MARKAMLFAAVAAACAAAAGCVERQMTLVTEPAGAKAYYNGKYVGTTPVTFHFTYYADPDLKFEKDGYKTLRVIAKVKPPVYEAFPLDFFSEGLIPANLHDGRKLTYALEKTTEVDVKALLGRAEDLRAEIENVPGEKPAK